MVSESTVTLMTCKWYDRGNTVCYLICVGSICISFKWISALDQDADFGWVQYPLLIWIWLMFQLVSFKSLWMTCCNPSVFKMAAIYATHFWAQSTNQQISTKCIVLRAYI